MVNELSKLDIHIKHVKNCQILLLQIDVQITFPNKKKWW